MAPVHGEQARASTRTPRPIERIENARDVCLPDRQELYELFYENYTKNYGLYPHDLSSQVTRLFSIRFDSDTRYFDDPYQCVPKDGFTPMFERMIASPDITVRLGTDYRSVATSERFGRLIYTGPIDEYFDYTYGRLPYRSLAFRFETLDVADSRRRHGQHQATDYIPHHGVQTPDATEASQKHLYEYEREGVHLSSREPTPAVELYKPDP